MKGKWNYNEAPLTVGDRVIREKNRITLSSTDYDLEIANTKKTDEGNYTCKDGDKVMKNYSVVAKGDFL